MNLAMPNIFHLRKYVYLFFNSISSDCIIPGSQYILFLDHILCLFWMTVLFIYGVKQITGNITHLIQQAFIVLRSS